MVSKLTCCTKFFFMKTILISLISIFSFFNSFSQTYPWTKNEIMPAKDLAVKLRNAKDLPLVLNVGPMENIKTAVKIGTTSTNSGLGKLTKFVSGKDKSKEVVIYCGCCAYANCPNIIPAYNKLKELGFKKVSLLDLPVGILPDWTDKGYPME
jgi:thiosulfate/3-mercaptopyruvate sulfurtransferase